MAARIRRLILLIALVACGLWLALPGGRGQAQPSGKPFSLPLAGPPGPTTWLLSQQYGSTIGAFNYGRYWYAAGQDLHFGVDFWAPCGTPILAIADGEIDQVDNMSFGLEPHNLTIFHRDLSLTSVYGHLNAKPGLTKGQAVKRGDVIGQSGDADGTCASRPHLHLEIRSRDYTLAYNPLNLIDADWDMLGSIGYQGFGGFVKDLANPNRWQSAFAQPDIDFNENPLNRFALTWPTLLRNGPQPQTLPTFNAPPLPAGAFARPRQITRAGCCSWAWWPPDSKAALFWDGPDGQAADLFSVDVSSLNGPDLPAPVPFGDGTPRLYSPDGQWEIRTSSSQTIVINRATGEQRPLATGGAWPHYSPGSTRLLWQRFPADAIPGSTPPLTEVWIANANGTGRKLLDTQQAGWVRWLDDERILRARPAGRTDESVLSIYTLNTGREAELTKVKHLRGLSVSPGGGILLFYAPFQDDPQVSGTYGILTQPGAQAVKLPFFGSYRWRDSKTVLYVLYNGQAALTPGPMTFAMYDVTTGEQREIIDPGVPPFSIANDEWSVSPDGQHIVFWNARDEALWVIDLFTPS